MAVIKKTIISEDGSEIMPSSLIECIKYPDGQLLSATYTRKLFTVDMKDTAKFATDKYYPVIIYPTDNSLEIDKLKISLFNDFQNVSNTAPCLHTTPSASLWMWLGRRILGGGVGISPSRTLQGLSSIGVVRQPIASATSGKSPRKTMSIFMHVAELTIMY